MKSFSIKFYSIPVILFFFIVCADAQVYETVEYSKKSINFNKQYLLDDYELMADLKASIVRNYPKKIDEKDLHKFAYDVSLYTSDKVGSGFIYSNWDDFENYLNDIMKQVIPKEIIENNNIKIYLNEKASFNASCMPNGIILFNIGCMSYIYNEAMIAYLIAHEVAHYYSNHSLKEYLQDVRGNFNDIFGYGEKDRMKLKYNAEFEADSIGAYWYLNSKYNPNAILQLTEVMTNLDLRNKLKRESFYSKKSKTHPESEKRLEILNHQISNANSSGMFYSIVSDSLFTDLREKSKPEILRILLENNDLLECIDRAFVKHIFDPENSVYIYYLMESIRRHCYLSPLYWNKQFITNKFHDAEHYVMNDGQKINPQKHIFERFPLEILAISKNEAQKIKAKFYWKIKDDVPKFITYQEAFEFFYKVSLLYNEDECELSYALSFTKDKAKRNKHLKNYIYAEDNILFREYAEVLLKNNLQKALPDKTLVVFDDFQAFAKDGEYTITLKSKNGLNTFDDKICADVIEKIPLDNFINLKKIKVEDLEMYKRLKSLKSIANNVFKLEDIDVQFHILDPRHWYTMKTLNVNDVWFVDAVYTEFFKFRKSLDEVENLTNTSLEDILKESEKTRFFNSRVLSAKDVSKVTFSFIRRYRSTESKLINKNDGHYETLRCLTKKLNAFHNEKNNLN